MNVFPSPRRQRLRPGLRAVTTRHGISLAGVEEMIRRQGGRCLICGREVSRDAWNVDHDHALARLHGHDEARGCPRCVRGLLCSRCNTLLGMCGDDVSLLERAALYLHAARTRR